jgi:hypothetical protein
VKFKVRSMNVHSDYSLDVSPRIFILHHRSLNVVKDRMRQAGNVDLDLMFVNERREEMLYVVCCMFL